MSRRDLIKKIAIISGIVLAVIIVIIAVFFPPNGKMICKVDSAPGDPFAEYTYTVNFKLWKVKKVEAKQIITSKNKSLLQSIKEEQEQASSIYKNSNYYTYTTSLKGKELTSISTVDYTKANMEEIVTKEGKSDLFIRNLKKLYQKGGATCSYK